METGRDGTEPWVLPHSASEICIEKPQSFQTSALDTDILVFAKRPQISTSRRFLAFGAVAPLY
jgi:hypothetical protein